MSSSYLSLSISLKNSRICFDIYAEITDRQLKNNDDFVWAIEVPLTGKFIIDVEFLDLKIAPTDVCILYLHLLTL